MLVLFLLIAVTLLGLAALRGTIMEERMSAHMFDRSLAFQAAESALRIAEQKVQEAAVAGRSIGVDCSSTGVTCAGTPSGLGAASHGDCAANASGCWIRVGATSSYSEQTGGAPQYYIEYMGNVEVRDENAGAERGASANQGGATQSTYRRAIYRISARSHDPRGSRAVVALQATMELRSTSGDTVNPRHTRTSWRELLLD